MKKIWVQPVDGQPLMKCLMPDGAIIRHVGFSALKNLPCIWFEIDQSEFLMERWFAAVPTGVSYSEKYQYVGTAVDPTGFVLHILEFLK